MPLIKFIQQDSVMYYVVGLRVQNFTKVYNKDTWYKLLGIVAKVLNLVWMTSRCLYIITGWLPGDSSPYSSHVVILDDNN